MSRSVADDKTAELEDLRRYAAELEGEAAALRRRLADTPAPADLRRLAERQRLEGLGALAGGVAHDFNNLLTVVLGNVDLARTHLPPGSPVLPFLAAAEQAGRRGADLCRQMLAFARLGRCVAAPLDLAAVLLANEALLRAALPPHVSLAAAAEGALPPVLGDAAQIGQALHNLVGNAAEALGDAGGVVRVTAGRAFVAADELAEAVGGADGRPGEHVCLEVRDDGCGMADEVRRRAFEPFFSTKFTGRGLGLPAVLGIVRGHRGALLLTTAPGRGCTVRLLFPRHDEEE
jgi:signal transduction histidine kinase